MQKVIIPALLMMFLQVACKTRNETVITGNKNNSEMKPTINKTEEEWKALLTPEQYQILREKGTERPFTGKYNKHYETGIYTCAACGTELFESDGKFDSGCGWPSFFKAAGDDRINTHVDRSLGMERTEITCAKCGGHLGHVFNDGPPPTGLRFCVNSASLNFKEKK